MSYSTRAILLSDDPEPEGEYVRVVREYVTAPKRPDVTPLPLSELQAIYSALTLESRFGTSKSHQRVRDARGCPSLRTH